MRACTRCGTSNDDAAKACAACGMTLDAGPKPALKQTMLGMAPGQGRAAVAPPAAPAAKPGAPAFGGTMIGLQTPFNPPPAPPAARVAPPAAAPLASATVVSTEPTPKKAGLQQTMLGFGPGPVPAPQPSQPQPPARPVMEPYRTQPGFAAPAGRVPETFGSTLAAVQGPGQTAVVPTSGFEQAPVTAQQTAAPQAVAAPHVAAVPAAPLGDKRTMLGVAMPGIAPLHPGQANRPPAEPLDPPPTPRGPSSYPPPGTSSAPPPDFIPKRARTPKSAVALVGVAVVLAIAGVVGALLWESPPAITAEVDVDDHGSEVLALECKDCPDGETASLDATSATFTGHKARLAISKPLKLGQNDLKLGTKRPGSSKTADVAISVSVDYRMKGDLSSLADEHPNARVIAEAAAGTAVVVDGHALSLDASGKAEYPVDVSHDIEGPADAVVPFERQVPYTVTPHGGKPHEGQVTLKFGIVPLRVDAPGLGIVIENENFTLAGRTLKDGRITVSGRPITVDGSGRFAQLMNISSEGETTIAVRADAKDYGPRIVRVRVKRVARLADEGAHFRQTAADEYSSIGDADTKKGFAVALDGEVVESRLDGDVTVLLLDVKRGCGAPPCLARVVYGGRFDAKRGAALTAYGQVLRAVDGPRTGVRIPEVGALFLVRTKTKGR